MAFGFITIFTGSFIGGIWILIIGWFLQTGSQSSLQSHELSSVLSHVRLKSIMNSQFANINMNQTTTGALINSFNKYRKSEFLVLDNQGYLVGSISAKQIMVIQEDSLEKVKISQIMTPLEELIVMSPKARADKALKRILSKNKSRIFVCKNGSGDNNNIQGSKDIKKEDRIQHIKTSQFLAKVIWNY
jgi:predicted transcriptional regulator